MRCRECGTPLPDDRGPCPWCGALPSPAAPAHPGAPELSPEELDFERRLYRFPYVTAVLGAVCVLIWAWMEWEGGSEDPTLLVVFGAKHRSLITSGEVWRLVSASFLHIGWKHLAFNGLALAQLGLFCENIFGRARFLALYLVAGIGGFALAAGFSDAISAGASASLFGLMGAIVVFGWRHRREIPPFFQHLFTWMLLPWVVLNLALGGLFDNVDNLAHVGGLVAGVALAGLLGNHIMAEEGRRLGRGAVGAAGAAALLLVAGLVGTGQSIARDLPTVRALTVAGGEGDLTATVELWTTLVDREPTVGLYRANRADALALTGDIDAAAADLRAAISLGHSPASARNQLAWLLITRGEVDSRDIEEAIRLARRSVSIRKGADNLNTLGWALYLKGDYQVSRTYLEAALELGNDNGFLDVAWSRLERLFFAETPESRAFDLYMLAMVSARLDAPAEARAWLVRADAAYVEQAALLSSIVDPPPARMAALDELKVLDTLATQAHSLIQPAP